MLTKEIVEYFHKQYPSEVSWAHACNTSKKFAAALQNDIDFLEVDIRVNPETGKPGLAHSVGDVFEVSVQELLQSMTGHHKGLKLDFKEQSAIEPVLEFIAESISTLGPLIINADVLQGPGAQKQGLSLPELASLSQKLVPTGLLSVGWINQIVEGGKYSEDNVQDMLTALKESGWQGDVTFAVRAHYLPVSWEALRALIEKPGYTLTIWNNEDVSNEVLQWIKDTLPKEKTFIDLYEVETGEPITF
jgi:hypothetical protein